MGPDLFGILWATGVLALVIGVFALVDRLVTGAWDALRGSPGIGLVVGMAAWRHAARQPGARRLSSSPGGAPPESPAPVATERVHAPRPLPWRGGRGGRVVGFAA